MPIYEYKCDKCSNVFDVIQKFVDQPLTIHENCGGDLHRLLSAPALQFKGSGWYVNDYAKGNNGGNSEKSGKKSDADSGKSESKPETKAGATSTPAPSSTSSSSSDKT